MEKKNTVLLTVIAIATLLVAVVGATFAYFSANQTNTAKVTVEASTAANDIFTAAGTGAVSVSATGAEMQIANGNDTEALKTDVTAEGEEIVISLTAGSETAKCTYDLVYTANTDQVFAATPAAQTAGLKELTLAGTDGNQSFGETDMNAIGTGTLYAGTDAEMTGTVLGSFEIVNTASTGAATVQTWTITEKLYNLKTIDQSATIAGKTYGGYVSVQNVVCDNIANN